MIRIHTNDLTIILQLLFGKLELPIEALRIIEESSPTPDSLQTNFGYVDECGNPTGISKAKI